MSIDTRKKKDERERVPEKREAKCNDGHELVRFMSNLKVPICPHCHKEVA
jgi:hypothetical protein